MKLRLSYTIAIGRSQGQTLDGVSLILPEPVFTHEQLYAALSKVRRHSDGKVKVRDNETYGRLIKL